MRVIRTLELIAVRVLRHSPILRCGECEHWFLRFDQRADAWLDHPEWEPRCAVCALFAHGHGDAWAVFNDCQGVFSNMVFWSRAEAARAAAEPENVEADCYVAPVQVIREPEWRVSAREFEEREREACQ